MFPRRLPDHIRTIDVFGAKYFIQWEDLPRGGSFFLPTTATPEQVALAVREHEEYLQIDLAIRARCEYGRYGVRIWRLS